MSSHIQPGGVGVMEELVMSKVTGPPVIRGRSKFDAVLKEYLTCKVGESLLVTIPDGIHMETFANGVRSICNRRGHTVPSVHIDKMNRQIQFQMRA